MNDTFDHHEFDTRLAVLEERMKTLQADLTATLEGFRTDQAKLREDMAKRETRMLLAVAGMIGLAVTILGLWLS